MSDPLEEVAFSMLAQAHPIEAYEMYPDRFWEYFHSKFPAISKDVMEKMILIASGTAMSI